MNSPLMALRAECPTARTKKACLMPAKAVIQPEATQRRIHSLSICMTSIHHLRRLFAPALAGLALCGAIALHADPAADARRAIQSAYNASGAAAARKDAAGTLAHFTPDAVAVDTKGHTTPMAQQQQTVTRLFAAAQSVTARTTIQKFTLNHPGQATATVHEHTIADSC